MKTIRLNYRDNKIIPSVSIITFFRSIGVYVYERFFGNNRNIIFDDVWKLVDPKDRTSLMLEYTDYDADIYVFQEDEDRDEYKRLYDDQGAKNIIILDDLDKSDTNIIDKILSKLFDHGVISLGEKEELEEYNTVFKKNDYTSVILNAKYFYKYDNDDFIKIMDDGFNNMIHQTAELMKCDWGDRRLFYTQFALLNLLYEYNCFCIKYRNSFAYDTDKLLSVCDILENNFVGYLGSSIVMLSGQIYDDLKSSHNSAYEKYVSCCREGATYNSFVYFKKGVYWADFANDYKSAVKYLLRAVSIYPTYYRAWYKLGVCYRKLSENEKAIISYSNVRRSLIDRVMGNCTRPLEMDYLYKAQSNIASIWEEKGNYVEAYKALKVAEKSWDEIDKSSFFDLMTLEGVTSEVSGSKRIAKDSNSIAIIYNKLNSLCLSLGYIREAGEYKSKLNLLGGV